MAAKNKNAINAGMNVVKNENSLSRSKAHNLPAMVVTHSDPFDLLVPSVTSIKKIALVNEIIQVKRKFL